MEKIKKIIKILILSVLLFVIRTSVFAKEIKIQNSTIYNYALDVYTNEYSRTLIQDNIINATCNWSYNGCAVQIPLTERLHLQNGRNYKFTILVSVPKGTQILKGSWGKNLSFSEFNSNEPFNALWRIHEYRNTETSVVKNADFNYTLQSSNNSIDIYALDYSFNFNGNYNIDIVALLFALNSSNSIQTGTLKFSYLMLDASNEDIVNAVNDLKSNIDDVKNSVDDVKNSVDDLNKNITSPNVPNKDELSSKLDTTGWLKPGPVDSIINMPLNLINNLLSSLNNNTCSPLIIDIPYLKNKQLTIPCISTLYEKMGLSSLFNSIGVVASAFILFRYLVGFYKWVDDTLSFREQNWGDF